MNTQGFVQFQSRHSLQPGFLGQDWRGVKCWSLKGLFIDSTRFVGRLPQNFKQLHFFRLAFFLCV